MMLAKILESVKLQLSQQKTGIPQEELMKKLNSSKVSRNFKHNINIPHKINLIAELKKTSPTKAVFRKDFDAVSIARIYQANGANALSVLTEKEFFGGQLEFINEVKNAVSLPILRKDFIIDEYQIYESAVNGADALLLIADILTDEELKRYSLLAKSLGVEPVIEVHTEEDLEKTLSADAQIIGINNRDLHTFKVDMQTTERLIRLIPKGKIIISESGIKTHEDVMFLKSLGVSCVLIGEAFLSSVDIGAKLREVMGVV